MWTYGRRLFYWAAPALWTQPGLWAGHGLALSVGIGLALGPAFEASATTLTYTIGDDDGFGGTQGSNSDPGDAFTVFNTPAISPGTYAGTTGMDVTTQSPWTTYSFVYTFNFDTAMLGAIQSATAIVQSGSVARRTNGTGYGLASVNATLNAGTPLDLGEFWTTGTGNNASPAEENVKAHVFDLTTLIPAGTTGTLVLTIDGDGLIDPNPGDRFAIDFAELTITGTPIPEPTTAALGLACLTVTATRRRRREALSPATPSRPTRRVEAPPPSPRGPAEPRRVDRCGA